VKSLSIIFWLISWDRLGEIEDGLGMFFILGIKIDNALWKLRTLNRRLPWYKIYGYFYCKKHKSIQLIDTAYNIGYLYKWQYERLRR
jgi:hypothetical protein